MADVAPTKSARRECAPLPDVRPVGIHWPVVRHIPTLDALRGAAALGVVVHHSFLQHRSQAPAFFFPLGEWLGQWGVILFYVLSGFCIHLPQARTFAAGTLAVNWRKFAWRRARRLLPTHYAALGLSAIVALFAPSLLLSRPTLVAFVAHVFMVHTLSAATIASINGVFWTIGTEVHFYVLYPVYLWMRHRLGALTVPLLMVVSLATHAVAMKSHSEAARTVLDSSVLFSWWQWALGAGLADVYVQGRTGPGARIACLPGAPWVWGAASLAVGAWNPALNGLHLRPWIAPLIFAALLFGLVVRPARTPVVRFFQPIGFFSYSLYLIHPVAIALLLCLPLDGTPVAARFALDIAASVALSWAFFQLVERHFLNTQPAAVTPVS